MFHPDGRRLLFGAREGGIAVWDSIERRIVRRLPLDFRPNGLALDPEGRRLAVNTSIHGTNGTKPRVAILELETGRVLFDWRSQVGNGDLAWSADGQLLAVGSGSRPRRLRLERPPRGPDRSASGAYGCGQCGPLRALGLPAGDLELGRHDPALGRRLG